MARYYTHLLLLPDESHLKDFVVELIGSTVSYYPFVGEIHSTIYIETPILLSRRNDLQGKTIYLGQLGWAFGEQDVSSGTLYAYRLVPCSLCVGERFMATKL